MQPIRTIIVDDETLARDKIKTLLAADTEVEIVAECSDGHEAVAAMRELAPDLIFLDVQMPELDGFGVLKQLGASKMPTVIFVTAYDKYALRAFEVHALDYLLKPFDRSRFQKALQRAKTFMAKEDSREVNSRLLNLLQDLQQEERVGGKDKYLARLVIKASGRVYFLQAQEIDYIESAGNYVHLHQRQESHLLRETMGNLEARLDPNDFVRVHRSLIVRIDCIKEIQPWFNGEYVLVLKNGKKLTSGRGYRSNLMRLLRNEN